MLYYENLYIRNCVPLRMIDFSLSQKINCHSNACLRAELNEDALEVIMCWKEFEPVTIADKESGCNLFSGIVKELRIYWERGMKEVRMDLVSGTYLLDLKRKKCSYQKKQSYRELAENLIPDKSMLVYLVQEREIPNLLVQYDETDWGFIDRLASHLQTCIIPEINTSCEARFYFGIKKGVSRGEADVFSYREGLDGHYHNAKSSDRNTMKQEYIYYEIVSYENYGIGDYLMF